MTTIQVPHTAPISEAALLGALLVEPLAIDAARSILPGQEVFYSEANADLYRLICDCDQHKGDANIATIADSARLVPSIVNAGGSAYLERLMSETPGAAGVNVWSRDILTAWRRRRLVAVSQAAVFDLGRTPENFPNVLDGLETALLGLHDGLAQSQPESLGSLLDSEFERITSGRGREGVIPTGYSDLDGLLCGGMGPGDFIVLAARPSMGKSAKGLCIASNIARRIPVAFLSLEMGRESVAQRLISITTGMHLESVVTGRVLPGSKSLAECDMDWLNELKGSLFVDDQPGYSPMQIRARARSMVRQHGVKVVVIDYLQLMHTGGRVESRQVEVSEISRSLKALARELNIPVLCLAQLNRSVEGRADFRPRMSDLRESGSIEQDADVVMLLHREEYYHLNDPAWAMDAENRDKVGVAEVIVAKQRNGPTGVVKMNWHAECARFRAHDGRYLSEQEERSYVGVPV